MNIKFKKIFDWTIEDVECPTVVGTFGALDSYQVVVVYKHHGKDIKLFDANDERMWGAGRTPEKLANDYWLDMERKRLRQRKRPVYALRTLSL